MLSLSLKMNIFLNEANMCVLTGKNVQQCNIIFVKNTSCACTHVPVQTHPQKVMQTKQVRDIILANLVGVALNG